MVWMVSGGAKLLSIYLCSCWEHVFSGSRVSSVAGQNNLLVQLENCPVQNAGGKVLGD